MRALLVEDHESMADAITRGLAAEGFDIDHAADGVDGLWRAREFTYDVIVLDVMLPGLNGYEICRTLRADGCTAPILMLTAKDGEYDVAEGLDLGADDYLTKPFSFVVLVARLRALVRRGPRTANGAAVTNLITAGPVAVDPVARRCTVDGAEVELTAREFALLETLARNVGLPLTRQQLLDHVWGGDNDATSNVVDVYVGYLRKKLRAGSEQELIQTVRGHGYRMVDRPGQP
jgi:DNA-binding response OmpR family regulator